MIPSFVKHYKVAAVLSTFIAVAEGVELYFAAAAPLRSLFPPLLAWLAIPGWIVGGVVAVIISGNGHAYSIVVATVVSVPVNCVILFAVIAGIQSLVLRTRRPDGREAS